MGNYKNIEIDFIERTLGLIAQYEGILHRYNFEQQYNHTLLINCLLGLVVFPKEKAISYLPKERITSRLKGDMGIFISTFNEEYTDLKSLIVALRHAIAHFNNEVYQKSLEKNYKGLFPSDTDTIERVLWGNYMKDSDIHKRPMAKFMQDIRKQLLRLRKIRKVTL